MSKKSARTRMPRFGLRFPVAARWLPTVGLALLSCNKQNPPASVECVIDYWGESHTAILNATTDPYRVTPLKIDDAFEFKGVYVAAPAAEASLAFYAYYETENGPVIVEQTQYLPPFPGNTPTSNGSFTGTHHVYGAGGEELTYACHWRSP